MVLFGISMTKTFSTSEQGKRPEWNRITELENILIYLYQTYWYSAANDDMSIVF